MGIFMVRAGIITIEESASPDTDSGEPPDTLGNLVLIPGTPEAGRSYRTVAMIVAVLFASLSVAMLVISHGNPWPLFALFLVSSLFAFLNGALNSHYVIDRTLGTLTVNADLLGRIVIRSHKRALADFLCVERGMLPGRINLGDQIDRHRNDEFSPKVYLVERDNTMFHLQTYFNTYYANHPLSKAWASRIAEAAGLPLVIQFDDSTDRK